MDLPYLFGPKVVIHDHEALFSWTPYFCLALPLISSLQPVCQQAQVHSIYLDRQSKRRNCGREFVEEVKEVRKSVRRLRPKRRQLPPQHLGLAPESSVWPSLPVLYVELTVGEGPVRGLLYCCSQVLYMKRFSKN